MVCPYTVSRDTGHYRPLQEFRIYLAHAKKSVTMHFSHEEAGCFLQLLSSFIILFDRSVDRFDSIDPIYLEFA